LLQLGHVIPANVFRRAMKYEENRIILRRFPNTK